MAIWFLAGIQPGALLTFKRKIAEKLVLHKVHGLLVPIFIIKLWRPPLTLK
jgi:hypothetical protein